MAGIGFTLRKMMGTPSLLNVLRAYTYAGLISSGPLLMSIISLTCLSMVMSLTGTGARFQLLYATITYVYGFSLILTGPVQLVLVRHAADCDYLGRRGAMLPFLGVSLAVTGLFALGLSGFFLGFVLKASLVFRWAAILLAVLVSWIWLLSGLVTALKQYNRVLISFAAGYGSGFLAGALLVMSQGPDWALLGFAIGHLVLFVMLLMTLFAEVPADTSGIQSESALVLMKRYGDLSLAGFLYNLGIWADKIIFWNFAPGREVEGGLLGIMPIYDQAVYLGFLSIIPGMAVFLLRLESEFAHHYTEFFNKVTGRGSLRELESLKSRMVQSLRDEFLTLAKWQGTLTLALLILAPRLMPALGLGRLQTGVFQIVILGSFLLILFLTFLTVLFYLDKRRDAVIACGLFCLINGSVSWLSTLPGETTYGVGYVCATAIAAGYAALRANYHLDRLEYDTFARQPVIT